MLARLVLVAACAALAAPVTAASTGVQCTSGPASAEVVGAPTASIAWRAGLETRTVLHVGPSRAARPVGTFDARTAPWLAVVGARSVGGACWLELRLPVRPNDATGWVDAHAVAATPTPWRIVVSRRRRTLELLRGGVLVETARVVVGKPSTPTPRGLFSVLGVEALPPGGFYGSWSLTLTAHSDVLARFEGGDGRVGIHGRGGASLRDPLGTAASHGCIRLANDDVDRLVRLVGAAQLPGTPVEIDA